MSDNTTTTVNSRPPRRGLFPPELHDILSPSLKLGGMTGTVGAITGFAAGTIRDTGTPVLFGFATGVQWFMLGSSYWFTRSLMLKLRTKDHDITPGGKIQASAVAGGATGLVGGLFRGPRNILPGVFMFSILGGGGQALVNFFHATDFSFKNRRSIFESKWSPLKKLSDEEYVEMMDEKILRIDAEIALIEEKIAELRQAPPPHSEGGKEQSN
ncbi:hypothetical protein F5X68DRAFT_265888 [Plectosphaerella plurivora]|uniref:Uncharacterized protein n=1 Tax=Plectosphaerella plurivora TaxID=936078 RepID=A0A9P9A3Q8_9PEZI|nr:hypothetical protein F5X68DRAFT_265888 [Plectosphaerella plurivora]